MAGPDAHYYEPERGHGLAHDPFKAIVAPRPIGWVSSLAADGTRNLAPYSFFNAVADTPPMIAFSSSGRKHSVANIEATGSFCWNLATRPLAEAMNRTSATVGAEIDEFALAGLTATPSRRIAAPRVAESPVNFECRLAQIIRLRAADQREIDNWLVLGEVVAVHIDRAAIVDGSYATARMRPILRAGGHDYQEASEERMFFTMVRPK